VWCRVGEGPFPTELKNSVGDNLRAKGGEYGTTTGRPRRCGWIDIPQLRFTNMINGFSAINLTKLDVLTGFDEIKIGTKYMLNGQELHHVSLFSVDCVGRNSFSINNILDAGVAARLCGHHRRV
jgi:adenylosuccinate synthase